tara:strand:- start:2906 stop:3517 length:612 start_codon:yes stop_codon:yes gene_type:complete
MSSIHLLKLSRLEGLTDGIFAIAMTIMVLNLHVPVNVPTSDILPFIKKDIYTNLFIYAGSFIILGTHWIAMNFQWGLLDHLNRAYLWANMFYLMVICVVPFSANLLGEYPYNTDSIDFYAANLLCCSLGQVVALECANYYKLYKDSYTPNLRLTALRRLLIAPIFYLSAIIAARWSIMSGFILLVAPTLIYLKPGHIDRFDGG